MTTAAPVIHIVDDDESFRTSVARLLRVSPSSLRNWERLGLIKPGRTAGRYRLYSLRKDPKTGTSA